MKAINQAMISLYIMATSTWNEFKEAERGDTNFISILLILAIVIVLGGLFYLMGDKLMDTISKAVDKFLSDVGLNAG